MGFSCRLPVVTDGRGAGFISFPSGSYTADPGGAVDSAATHSFDGAANRWVPAPAWNIAPDGSSYAYAAGPAVHVVNVMAGTEKAFSVSLPGAAAVAAYDGRGAYLVSGQQGVWRLDTSSGKVTALTRVNGVMAVRDGYAWIGTVDPHDPNPPVSQSGQSLFDTIAQVNLSTGAQMPWYYTLGRSDVLLGLASGDRPIVAVSDAPDYSVQEIRVIDHANTSGGEDNGELVSGPGPSLFSPQADGDRVWFGSLTGIYLYTQSAGLQKVFANPAPAESQAAIEPAGVCR